MKKVLILNPPSSDSTYINRDQMGGMGQKLDFGRDFKSKILSKLKSNFIHIPVVQLVYAATMLAENGFEVKVIDALNLDYNLDQTLAEAKTFTPDYIVMEVSSSCLIFEREVVAKKLKDLYPNALIITTGDIITHDPEQFKPPFDVSILGEVERVILDVCNNSDLSQVEGIMYLKDGQVVKSPLTSRLQNEELEILPFPRWDLFPIHRYVYQPLLNKKPVASLQSTRGCPYGCGYCSYPANQGLKWRSRTAKNIVDEIEKDLKEYGFKAILFRDPLFTLKQDRVKEMCELIKQRGLKFEFAFETRPELLTTDLLDALKEAGCKAINFGVEDIHEDVLRKIKRVPISLEKIREIVGYAEKIGIRTTCFFIIGLPGSTRQTIKETIDFSKELNPSYADYKIATPYPGTYLQQLAKENNWIKDQGYDSLGGYSATMQISPELTPEFLEKTCKDAFNSYYMRPSYITREVKRGTFLTKAKMVVSNLVR